jgi:hypothetical protein
MNTALYKALNSADITIARPQRDVYLKSSIVPEGKGKT